MTNYPIKTNKLNISLTDQYVGFLPTKGGAYRFDSLSIEDSVYKLLSLVWDLNFPYPEERLNITSKVIQAVHFIPGSKITQSPSTIQPSSTLLTFVNSAASTTVNIVIAIDDNKLANLTLTSRTTLISGEAVLTIEPAFSSDGEFDYIKTNVEGGTKNFHTLLGIWDSVNGEAVPLETINEFITQITKSATNEIELLKSL